MLCSINVTTLQDDKYYSSSTEMKISNQENTTIFIYFKNLKFFTRCSFSAVLSCVYINEYLLLEIA
jgi:hypothetical protein